MIFMSLLQGSGPAKEQGRLSVGQKECVRDDGARKRRDDASNRSPGFRGYSVRLALCTAWSALALASCALAGVAGGSGNADGTRDIRPSGERELPGDGVGLSQGDGRARRVTPHADGLEQVFQLESNVWSGSTPTTEEAMKWLAAQGVKLVISVDGARPEVELARKHGLRYVHLPIGYGGISAERVAQFVKAALTAEGPVYVHCHHGKHRGPAAAAVICAGIHGWGPGRGEKWLKEAGTGPEYAGLYRAVRDFKMPSAGELAPIPARQAQVAEIPDEVEAMVAIDGTVDLLKAAQKTEWREIPGSAVTPREAAVNLWEQHRELSRHTSSSSRGAGYVEMLKKAEEVALRFRESFENGAEHGLREARWQDVMRSCKECHREHRN
jgi:rhodanese-related sulfurtransferase